MGSSKYNILVVDDDAVSVKLLESYLSLNGYSVLKAHSGEEAFKVLSKNRVDLILLDIMMPEMDGFEVTRRLRGNDATRGVPIILVTALRRTKDRIKGIESGCDEFLSKPFNKEELLARVKTLLKLNYYRSQMHDKEKLENIVNNVEQGLVILDKNLEVSRINLKASEWLGIGTVDSVSDIMSHLEERFEIRYDGDLKLDLISNSICFDIERPETENTRALILETRTSVINDPGGEPHSIVLFVNNVTDLRKEESLKQNFLGLISHKLRTPLTSILLNHAMLEGQEIGELNDEQQEILARLATKIYDLKSNVEKLIGFNTVESRKLESHKQNIQMKLYLHDLIRPFLKLIKTKTIEMSIDCPDELRVNINKIYLDLIISNLVENAIKFNDKDAAKINIKVKNDDGVLEFAVSDNGPGIPPEERERIFDKFYQVEKYLTWNIEGVGLGLALVKSLVHACKGSIKLDSEMGKGATFTFTIPIN